MTSALRSGLEAERSTRLGVAALRLVVTLAVVLIGLAAPFYIRSPYFLGLLINAMLLGISAVSIGFLAHLSGLMMFGAAAFTGAATYIYAIAITQFGLGVLPACALTLIASTLVFTLVGALISRARPLPFAMLTLALAQLLHSVVLITDIRPLTGGDDGLPLSFDGALFGIDQSRMSTPAGFWPVVWIAFCAVLAISSAVRHSRFGRVLRAIRANEERMRFSGFRTYAPRVAAFAIAGFMAAIAGLLAGLYTAFASPELLDFSAGGNALVATLIGGVGTVGGPALGALLFVIGQDRFGATGDLELLTGAGVVLVIYLFPEGVMGFLSAGFARLFRNAEAAPAGQADP